MFCTDFKVSKITEDRTRHVVADIVASTVPLNMPTRGEDVENLNTTDILDPGSSMIIVNSSEVYMMNEEHQWKKM